VSFNYVTRQELKEEIKDVISRIRNLASDQGGDIKSLHGEIVNFRETLSLATSIIEELKRKVNKLEDESIRNRNSNS
jgi:hypothetical protein